MKKLLSFILSAALIIAGSGQSRPITVGHGASAQTSSVSDARLEAYAEQVAYIVNSERKKQGLSELQMLPVLNKAAAARSDELVQTYSHERPDGRLCFTVLDEFGVGYRAAAENIFKGGYLYPETAMNGWMNSEGHRNNILNPDYQYIGVGLTRNGNTYYWTQLFVKSPQAISGAYLPTAANGFGDVDFDGRVSGKDATLVLSEYADLASGKSSGFTALQKKYADIDGDGMASGKDASVLLQYYAYLSSGGTQTNILVWYGV